MALNLLDYVAKMPPIAAKLRALGKGAVVFDHVDEAAQPFVAGLVAAHARQSKKPRRTWIVAPHLRSQERIHNELSNWLDAVFFLPEVEIPSRKLPGEIQRVALRKLIGLNQAERVEDLRVPPGNRLEALKGNRTGAHSIRINGQWRICFV